MKQQTKRFLSIVLAVFFLVFALVLYANFIRAAYGEAQGKRREQLSREAFLEGQRQAIGKVQNLISSLQGGKISQLRDTISLALPLEQDAAGVIGQINGLIRNNEVELQSITFSPPRAEGKRAVITGTESPEALIKAVGSMQFTLKFTGSYADFKNFLEDLETNIRIIEVRNLGIAPSGRVSDNIYSYDLTVVSYYQNI